MNRLFLDDLLKNQEKVKENTKSKFFELIGKFQITQLVEIKVLKSCRQRNQNMKKIILKTFSKN